ncbi:MAG: response regulator transcription factor [Campylobacteraceae bacterium]|nr:response regulator transcription factor [Campylobacteraceae bacterium]
MKILLLEDDFAYRESIREYLESLGYYVEDFENGEDALDALFKKRYDLLLLDIRVPGIDGYEIVKILREYKIDTPVIFVTSLTDIQNLSLGYELGCNDYIRKPFAMKELKYRVAQVLKNKFGAHDEVIPLNDNFYFCVKDYRLQKNGVDIGLSRIEQKLMNLFVANIGRILSPEVIKEYVWEGEQACDTDVRMAIKKLRDKTTKDLIKNIRGQGYGIEKRD